MEGEQHAVAGHVHVGLEVVVAQRDRVLERRQGVLQARDLGVVGAAAVGEREHAARVAGHLVEVGEAGRGRRHSEQYGPSGLPARDACRGARPRSALRRGMDGDASTTTPS